MMGERGSRGGCAINCSSSPTSNFAFQTALIAVAHIFYPPGRLCYSTMSSPRTSLLAHSFAADDSLGLISASKSLSSSSSSSSDESYSDLSISNSRSEDSQTDYLDISPTKETLELDITDHNAKLEKAPTTPVDSYFACKRPAPRVSSGEIDLGDIGLQSPLNSPLTLNAEDADVTPTLPGAPTRKLAKKRSTADIRRKVLSWTRQTSYTAVHPEPDEVNT
jgi:hypothetical protein